MSDIITKTVRTKMTADHDAVETVLHLDFTGLSNEDIKEIAAQSAVIKWQGNARRGKEIPVEDTYKVPKPGTKSMSVDYAGALVKLFGGDKAMTLIKKHGTAEEAYKVLKPLLDAMMEDMETEG